MSVQEIESAISQLPPEDLAQLTRWFDEYVERTWNACIEADAQSGKFDHFKEKIAQARAKGELLDFP
jgi:hypothetical protein